MVVGGTTDGTERRKNVQIYTFVISERTVVSVKVVRSPKKRGILSGLRRRGIFF